MEQPNIKDQQELISIDNNEVTEVLIPGTKDKVKVGWMRPYTLERSSKLILKKERELEKYEPKLLSKLASLYILNGVKIFFLHPLYWRYLYYIKGYRYDQLIPIIETAKKKVPVEAYIKAIILASGMKTTLMGMTQEEAESIQVGLL
ncbi:hypothetical protein ACGE0T_14335 [Parabacteroides sp. APC149_11_2_Y6]